MSEERRLKMWWWAGALAMACALTTTFLIYWFFAPPRPPSELKMATGSPQGAYHAIAKRYKEAFAKEGFNVQLVISKGSVENVDLLKRGAVDLALVQSGVSSPKDPELQNLRSLGGLFKEPIWLFYRGPDDISKLNSLAGVKVSLGPTGGGTDPVARHLLKINGIDSTEAELLSMDYTRSKNALLAGEIDAAFFIAAETAPMITELLETPDIKIMNFQRYLAYIKKLKYVRKVEVPMGLIDIEDNIPSRDIILLAATASMMAKEDLHPAVAKVFAKIAKDLHSSASVFQDHNEFPLAEPIEFPLHEAAEEYYENGPSFLSRYLPFWAVLLISRLTVLILPLVTLALPVAKVAPKAYRWGMNRRIYKWYNRLSAIEQQIDVDNMTPQDKAKALSLLEELSDTVAKVKVPYVFQKDVYNLRLHIQMVRDHYVNHEPKHEKEFI
jgi:TRAP transporter TAXI family solute receptor